jgi:hypothetical protein
MKSENPQHVKPSRSGHGLSISLSAPEFQSKVKVIGKADGGVMLRTENGPFLY